MTATSIPQHVPASAAGELTEYIQARISEPGLVFPGNFLLNADVPATRPMPTLASNQHGTSIVRRQLLELLHDSVAIQVRFPGIKRNTIEAGYVRCGDRLHGGDLPLGNDF